MRKDIIFKARVDSLGMAFRQRVDEFSQEFPRYDLDAVFGPIRSCQLNGFTMRLRANSLCHQLAAFFPSVMHDTSAFITALLSAPKDFRTIVSLGHGLNAGSTDRRRRRNSPFRVVGRLFVSYWSVNNSLHEGNTRNPWCAGSVPNSAKERHAAWPAASRRRLVRCFIQPGLPL